MRVLVTGSCGFIGSHVTRELAKQGHKVSGIDLIGGYPYEQCDARDFFRESSQHFDLVIHCAAVVGGRQLIESPLAHAANLEIDAALFQWAERTRPGRIIYISSVAAYPVHLQRGEYPLYPLVANSYTSISATSSFSDLSLYCGTECPECHGSDMPDPRGHREGCTWVKKRNMVPAHNLSETDARGFLFPHPDELYGWAKLTGEMMAERSSVPVSIPRPFTVYGEGQDPVFPFASIMQQVRDRKDPVTVWGSGNQTRDFIHVDDVVNGMIAMAEEEIGGPVNFCTGRGVSLNELIRMMADAAGYSPGTEHLEGKPEGLPYRVGSPENLHKFYVPEVSLEEGIQKGLR